MWQLVVFNNMGNFKRMILQKPTMLGKCWFTLWKKSMVSLVLLNVGLLPVWKSDKIYTRGARKTLCVAILFRHTKYTSPKYCIHDDADAFPHIAHTFADCGKYISAGDFRDKQRATVYC